MTQSATASVTANGPSSGETSESSSDPSATGIDDVRQMLAWNSYAESNVKGAVVNIETAVADVDGKFSGITGSCDASGLDDADQASGTFAVTGEDGKTVQGDLICYGGVTITVSGADGNYTVTGSHKNGDTVYTYDTANYSISQASK